MVGKGYNALQQSALDLGSKIAALQGKNSVRDKKISSKLCATFGLPEGFDGPMHAMGVHVDLYDGSKCDPVHYGGTETMIDKKSNLLIVLSLGGYVFFVRHKRLTLHHFISCVV